MKMPDAKGGDFELAPAGAQLAICIRLIDLGTQQTEFKGERKLQRKIMIGWELPFEKTKKGEPFIHYKRYTLSSHEKSTLRKHLEM